MFYGLKLVLPHPLHAMLCRCSCYLQKTTNTPTLNGREGEECRFFCSLKSSYNNFVADCRVKATDIKIAWLTFFRDHILCGGSPWIEVPKRRYSIVIFTILLKFRSSLRKKKLLLWRLLVIQVWYTGCQYQKYCNLIGSYQ